MKRQWRKLGAVTGGMLLAAGLTTGSAGAANARPHGDVGTLSCYDVATSYSKPDGGYYYPSPFHPLTTTSRCSDINIYPNGSAYVAVCFVPSGGSTHCNGWTAVTANRWNVVATNVRDNTKFFFAFRSDASSAGFWAA